jgi:hypothetical protein
MAYREVSVIEVREVLRAWLAGGGLRKVAEQAGVDRKTARRYVEAAQQVGVVGDGGVGQLSDAVIGQIVELVRPARPDGHGSAWQALQGRQEQIAEWLDRGLTVVKVGDLLAREGLVVPYRTLHRFCVDCLGFGGRGGSRTVRVADGEPGGECQLDFGRLRMIYDPASGRTRLVKALIFTAVYSRHMFVWLSFSEALEAGDRRLRGRVAVLRRGVPGADPGKCSAEHFPGSVPQRVMGPVRPLPVSARR